jgi:hypothetical protein
MVPLVELIAPTEGTHGSESRQPLPPWGRALLPLLTDTS